MNEMKKQYTDYDIEYAAGARCRCGAGLAHPINTGEALRIAAWVCSEVLKGAHPAEHDSLPFMMYKVREESSINNRERATTRPPGTKCMTQGNATCPKCSHKWQSEPYEAGGLPHHWYSGPCPSCGHAVGGGSSYTYDRDNPPIDCRFPVVVVAA